MSFDFLNETCTINSIIEGKCLLINKPYKWTSFDVVNKIRLLLRTRLGIDKIKVGHTGTLDPLATGLMLVCIGKMTKNIDYLTGLDKEYIAEITFGGTTPSFDLETEINQTFDYKHITQEIILSSLKQFEGKQLQTPPLYSAIRVGGKRAYQFARKNDNIELKQREVTFNAVELINYSPPVATIRVNCSKGAYIRSFANDLGIKLQCGAYLSALNRTFIGNFSLKDAISIEEFENMLEKLSISK
jgi:tRNA pseudouridine55 synthase